MKAYDCIMNPGRNLHSVVETNSNGSVLIGVREKQSLLFFSFCFERGDFWIIY